MLQCSKRLIDYKIITYKASLFLKELFILEIVNGKKGKGMPPVLVSFLQFLLVKFR